MSDSSAVSVGCDLKWESGLFDRGSWSEAQVLDPRPYLEYVHNTIEYTLQVSEHEMASGLNEDGVEQFLE